MYLLDNEGLLINIVSLNSHIHVWNIRKTKLFRCFNYMSSIHRYPSIIFKHLTFDNTLISLPLKDVEDLKFKHRNLEEINENLSHALKDLEQKFSNLE